MTDLQKRALERLIGVAHGRSGQCRTVADFLLAWWNATDCGGFDLANLWSVDTAIAADMIEVCGLIASASSYPDTLGYKEDFREIIRDWRPAFAWWDSLTETQQAGWLKTKRAITPAEAYADHRREQILSEQAVEI